MQVEKDKVVFFHYRLNDEAGNEIEDSHDRKPMAILFGHRNIIAGLEKAMDGRAAGDRFSVAVAPEDGYGQRRENFTQRVPKKYFPDPEHLRPGMTSNLRTQEGYRTVIVIKVGSSVVDVDLNHPMAGKTLNFDVEITDIRDASPEELEHGHVHGDGGHEH
jgi:FKBP-type peptidyl-prolyl cis-trans isomerase SlyD